MRYVYVHKVIVAIFQDHPYFYMHFCNNILSGYGWNV